MLLVQACSNLGKHEEAVQGMEQLCRVKAQAAGPKAVHAVLAAGTSLDSRLQVPLLSHRQYQEAFGQACSASGLFCLGHSGKALDSAEMAER